MLLGSPGEFGVDDRLWLPIGNTANIEGTTKVGGIVIPDAQLLFSGDFKRTGLDLVLSHDDRQFLIRDYFKGESRATLLAPDGASLSGQIVNSLTGHLDVAQAGANVSAAIIIGTVVKLTGNATAVRNGVVVTLNIGDKVHKGDVVQAGSDSALGISFIDGTAFSLGANARMVLNDVVYDPNGSSNSSLLSLVQGTISFVAGETAKNGNMKIDTPVATMGIRGTAVVVEMTANNGPVKFSVVAEPGGRSGSYVLLDKLSGLPIATVSQPGLITFVSATGVNQPLSIVEISKTPTDLLNERDVVKLAFSIAFPQFNFDDANPKTRFAFGTSGNNLADGNLLPHPFGGEYAAFKSATAGRLPGLLGGSDQLDWTLFINHDVPTSRAGTLVEDSVAPDQILVTSGTIVFLNLSPSAIKSTTFALAQSTMSASLPGFTNNVDQIGTFVVPNGGSAVITGINTTSTAVNWSFMLSGGNPVLQSLAMGQTLTQVYAVTVTMNDGTQLTQDVTVTMIGVNDTPTFQTSTNDTPTLIEDSVEQGQNLSTSGTIAFLDVDTIDTHAATYVLKSSTSTPHLPGHTDNISQIGSFVLTSGPTGVSEITTDTDNTATVGWSFTLSNNDPVLQSLAHGETLTQVYSVIITDNNGARVTHDISVTLVGANDTPIITAQDLIGAVTEQVVPAALRDSGVITFSDVDLTDVHLVSATGTPIGSVLGTLTAVKNTDTTGTGIGGQLTWTYTVADSAVAYLAAGQTRVESFTITFSDQKGSVITKQIDITINGTNDTPVIGGVSTGAVTEDVSVVSNSISTSGALTLTDVDQGQSSFAAQAGVAGTYGTFTLAANGAWTYTASNTQTAVQQLRAGQSISDSFTAVSADGTASQLVTVTINGTNDSAVIGGVSTGAVTEDVSVVSNSISTSGALTLTDVDQGQSSFAAQAGVAGTYGTFTLAANGAWTYTASNTQTAVQQLRAGQSISDSFTAVSADGTASQLVTIIINGTNDSAVIGGVSTRAVTEDVSVVSNSISTSGALTLTDVDQGQSSFVAQAGVAGTYGTFTLAANGAWTYTASNTQTAVQQLRAGQSITDSFTAVSADGSASQLVTVTINGTNDTPVIGGVSTGAVAEDVSVVSNSISTSGALTLTDVDQGQSSFAAQAGVAGTYGTFTLAANGAWTYTASNTQTAVQQLRAGQSISDSFTAVSADGTASQLVTIIINGTNDSAVIGGVSTGAVTEDVSVVSNSISTSGALTLTDVDQGQSSFAAQAGVAGTYGTFTLAANGAWTYTASNTQTAVQQLRAGQSITDSFTAVSADGSASQLVTVTINGTNDTPVIGGVSTGAVTEDVSVVSNSISTSGALTLTDVDQGQSSFAAQAGVAGTYGTFTLAANGAWTYTASNTQTAVQQLRAGQSISDSFTAVSADGTASQLVTIIINGTNDSAVIGGVSTGAVTEDVSVVSNSISTSGALTLTDVDQGQSSFAAQAGVAGTYGTFTLAANGAWTYTASNTQTAVQQLRAGQSITDSFTAVSADGSASQLVTVTINGTNDTPVIGGVSTGAVAEDATLTAGGALTIADADSGQSHFQAVVPASLTGTYGTFTFDPNTGVWGYTLDNVAAESLPTGQVAHDTLAVTSADGTASQLIDVTITSTNDAPIVQGGIFRVPNITQDNGQLVFDGQTFFADPALTVTDPDGPVVGIAIIGHDDASGQWQYQLAGTSEWIPITLSSGEALLLSADDRVRYKGDAHQDAEVLKFKAWDGSDGFVSGQVVTISEVGGSSAFSTGTYTAEAKNANTAPAGIAGEPINLGLADSSLGPDYTATVTIGDIPSDWIVNDGVHNLDGSWTVQTTNLASLSVITPVSYSGAYLLSVTATVALADGSIKTLMLGDNVEAYSPGSPIFAWSGDDYLTASSGDDLIVFAQPIGHDIIYSFDVAHDQIDLIGYAGFATFADVQDHLTEDANGNAMIALADGQSIVLDGIHAAAMAKTNFVFNQTPTLHNAGTMTISDGAFMPLSGTISNTGTIALSSTGDETDLQLIQYGVTLEGGGTVLLSDSDNNIISGTSSSVTLNNGDNIISGAGSLGNGELSLANAGTINATGTHALVIDTGSNVVLNSGTLEASGSGSLTVLSAVENSGLLWANGANLTIQGAVTGTGNATIDGSGVLDLEASSTASVLFGSGTGGTLKLGDAFHFNGTITGFDGEDVIDLEDIDSNAASISYQENTAGTGGTLTISDGAHVVELSLMGDYSAESFSLVPHQLQRTSITYVAHDLVV
ncbi:VCBS domain-containing protein [Bradyrhizobium sp. OAE829]|uniref:VCBS domain-containing protein n=1 Tax=Bradyrhizobium sp. OAE829 TaxID=2663807 RepID=UPI00339AF52D